MGGKPWTGEGNDEQKSQKAEILFVVVVSTRKAHPNDVANVAA